jgi:hypothetical protein
VNRAVLNDCVLHVIAFCSLIVPRDGGDRLQRTEVSSAQSWFSQEAFGKLNLCPQIAQPEQAAAPLTGSFGAKME